MNTLKTLGKKIIMNNTALFVLTSITLFLSYYVGSYFMINNKFITVLSILGFTGTIVLNIYNTILGVKYISNQVAFNMVSILVAGTTMTVVMVAPQLILIHSVLVSLVLTSLMTKYTISTVREYIR